MVRKTSRKRLNRALKRMNEWMRENRHQSLRYQVEKLGVKLKGHFGYYGITGNLRRLQEFRWQVIRQWRYWLNRRDRDHGSMSWERMQRLLDFWYLPPARVVHSALANHALEEPYAGNLLVRDCGGVGGQPPALPGHLDN